MSGSMLPTSMGVELCWNEADMITNYISDTVQFDVDPLSGHYEMADEIMYTPTPNISNVAMDIPGSSQGPRQLLTARAWGLLPSSISATHGDLGPPVAQQVPSKTRQNKTPSMHWTLSREIHKRLGQEILNHKNDISPEFVLPGRQMLSRYLASYIRGFQPHLPFLYVPTLSPESMSPVLLLALTAVGAFYGFEHPQGYALYFASRATLQAQLESRRSGHVFHLSKTFPRYAEISVSQPSVSVSDGQLNTPRSDHASMTRDLSLIQTLIVFMQLTSWADTPVMADAFVMTGQLVTLLRETLLQAPAAADADLKWAEWHVEEEELRTVYSAYIVLNLQTICFNTPPALTNSELQLTLPCSTAEWNADGPEAWSEARRKSPLHTLSFQPCLKQLLSGQALDKHAGMTAFGNYVLVHGLLSSQHQIGFLGLWGAMMSLISNSRLLDGYADTKTATAKWDGLVAGTLSDPS
ncbi:hypothetical protein G7Z17_g1701 [Cylindrodendrum hubeiense]|uniref:Xylanolytic transcriptional activator regulatory domain-containing protein n=1 Tax=Cylindrodendrum hubeiense TaxID=595255 RepID=A0A9P5HKA4_9HYPO|nr:hypothetical protein G7Z17_g1701 [Cylindrodendrum hubeiense]